MTVHRLFQQKFDRTAVYQRKTTKIAQIRIKCVKWEINTLDYLFISDKIPICNWLVNKLCSAMNTSVFVLLTAAMQTGRSICPLRAQNTRRGFIVRNNLKRFVAIAMIAAMSAAAFASCGNNTTTESSSSSSSTESSSTRAPMIPVMVCRWLLRTTPLTRSSTPLLDCSV